MVYLTFEYKIHRKNNADVRIRYEHAINVKTKYESAVNAAITAYGKDLICSLIETEESINISMAGDRESDLEKAMRSFFSVAGRSRPYMANNNAWIIIERAINCM